MCTNQRVVINPYTGTSFYVKCGRCPACLQEKAAHRVSRIKANDSPGKDTFLVTLTYRRGNCPYILRSEAYEFSNGSRDTLNVYRDRVYRKVRYGHDYFFRYKCINRTHVIQTLDFVEPLSLRGVKDMKHEYDKISIAYYPDLQKFFARLRLNLKRKYDYNKTFSVFACSEYGSKSLRSHFHFLLWIDKGDSEIFRNAIIESWPFSNLQSFPRSFEKCFRASSYVASYVNCGHKFPKFLKTYFPPKHSYSKGFGLSNKCFHINTILEKFYRGNLSIFKQVDKQGNPVVVECPYPKYVIHRYFPLFKGYNRFVGISQFEHLQRFMRDYEPPVFADNERLKLDRSFGIYTSDEHHKIQTKLLNAYERFKHDVDWKGNFPLPLDGYLDLHIKIWNLHRSTCLRLHMQNNDIPLNEKYDNLENVKELFKDYNRPLPVGFTLDMLRNTDPNKFGSVISRTRKFEQSYYESVKHRRVNNSVMSTISDEF